MWAKSGSRLSEADEARYQHLLVEWAAAVDAERSEDAAVDEEADAPGTAPPAPRTGVPLRLIRAA
ncbi:hypothetical protein FEF34_27495 [Streptomyces marianii]|uniref:Uncharacterized protein n=1 Tax=Streptomyces marianii TaxID=1817406 RepID=A0A5R9EEQ1_9ACTN|nr:hypothetical protein FEF34_27495 [Streptomyces marianii]